MSLQPTIRTGNGLYQTLKLALISELSIDMPRLFSVVGISIS